MSDFTADAVAGVGREFDSALSVESLYGVEEPQVADLKKIFSFGRAASGEVLGQGLNDADMAGENLIPETDVSAVPVKREQFQFVIGFMEILLGLHANDIHVWGSLHFSERSGSKENGNGEVPFPLLRH
jgi:hypothetical protein